RVHDELRQDQLLAHLAAGGARPGVLGQGGDQPVGGQLGYEAEDLVGQRVDADGAVGLEGGEDEDVGPGDAVGADADDAHRTDGVDHGRYLVVLHLTRPAAK